MAQKKSLDNFPGIIYELSLRMKKSAETPRPDFLGAEQQQQQDNISNLDAMQWEGELVELMDKICNGFFDPALLQKK